ncbi:MAG: hypothetical protein HYZ71_14265 [Deltaproteobacteria bacterium]|nr:hypothetical protein [Deltaproteobacteria bacterium]
MPLIVAIGKTALLGLFYKRDASRRGFIPVLVAFGLVSILAFMSLSVSMSGGLLRNKRRDSVNRMEAFYTTELIAWHTWSRLTDGLPPPGIDSKTFVDNNPYRTIAETLPPDDYSSAPGIPLNVAVSLQSAPTQGLIRRSVTELYPASPSSVQYCGKTRFVSAKIYRTCLFAKVVKPPKKSTLSAGVIHTCAIRSGRVQCWGNNDAGQLGYSTTPSILSRCPRWSGNLLSGVTSVMAGAVTTYVMVNGILKGWGRAETGLLGPGSTSAQELNAVTIPISGNAWVESGDVHACAVVDEGVQCWGANNYGQLGNTPYDDVHPQPLLAASLRSGSGVSDLLIGSHSCAAVRGALLCWGAPNDPLPVVVEGENAQIVTVVNRYDMARFCVLNPEGIVKCGVGSTLLPVSLPAPAIDVGLGADFACAVLENGQVWCWGKNHRGFLGNGSVDYSESPTLTVGMTSGATEIAVGVDHACALKNSEVWCWGMNSSGQLGDHSGPDIQTDEFSTVPVKVGPWEE